MPSQSQEINIDINSNEDTSSINEPKDDRNQEIKYVATENAGSNAPAGLSSDQKLAFALRDFLGPSSMVPSDDTPSPSIAEQKLPYIDEILDSDLVNSDEEFKKCQETEEALNNAACRLRRWRAASRKLRRPRIIDNLCKECGSGKSFSGGHTDLADRLRSLAAVGNMSASAGELMSLAPPPLAATAPSSPGWLLTPTLADQNSAEYFVSKTTKFNMVMG